MQYLNQSSSTPTTTTLDYLPQHLAGRANSTMAGVLLTATRSLFVLSFLALLLGATLAQLYEDEGFEPFEHFEQDSFPEIAFSPSINESTPITPVGPNSQVKVGRLDQVMDPRTRAWTYVNMAPNVTMENAPLKEIVKDTTLQEFAFLIVRKLEPIGSRYPPSFRMILLHKDIVDICKKIVTSRPGLSWHQVPMEIDPDILLSHYDDFAQYRTELEASDGEESRRILTYLNQLLSTLEEDFTATLSSLQTMRKNGEITFDYLKYILRPRQVIYHQCPITNLPRLCELASFHRSTWMGTPIYSIECEAIDLVDVRDGGSRAVVIDRVSLNLRIPMVDGVVKVTSLPAYPSEYHSRKDDIYDEILKRGKKWTQLVDVKHMHYNGVAAFRDPHGALIKQYVEGRIMIDRASFYRRHMNYMFPERVRGAGEHKFARDWDIPDGGNGGYNAQSLSGHMIRTRQADRDWDIYEDDDGSPQQVFFKDRSITLWDLTTEDLLLTPTVVYGFSLSDKQWLEFNVEKVSEIEWNDDSFPNLVLPTARKELLLSLIEAHCCDNGVEDFVRGKGQGLVINLYGPPGVGKTMSAEATSEHVRRPLYIVGSGDLGTDASILDKKLQNIFQIATAWNAIVLIDEADIFLERRSLHELQRNAMVAVFLRHIEYYRGILFLTTNRVQTFDDAFLSRIHVSLHFKDLDASARERVWAAFVKKLGNMADISEDQVKELASREINGRQIKNAVLTAQSMALRRGQRLTYTHLTNMLDALVEFEEEFRGVKPGIID